MFLLKMCTQKLINDIISFIISYPLCIMEFSPMNMFVLRAIMIVLLFSLSYRQKVAVTKATIGKYFVEMAMKIIEWLFRFFFFQFTFKIDVIVSEPLSHVIAVSITIRTINCTCTPIKLNAVYNNNLFFTIELILTFRLPVDIM